MLTSESATAASGARASSAPTRSAEQELALPGGMRDASNFIRQAIKDGATCFELTRAGNQIGLSYHIGDRWYECLPPFIHDYQDFKGLLVTWATCSPPDDPIDKFKLTSNGRTCRLTLSSHWSHSGRESLTFAIEYDRGTTLEMRWRAIDATS